MSELFVALYPSYAKNILSVNHKVLKIEELASGSAIVVSYKNASCSHVWDVPLRDLIKSQFKCPYCTNKNLLKGFNDVETKITSSGVTFKWEDQNNQASDVKFSSKKIHNWSCLKCGEKFSKSPFALFVNKVKCPYCNNKKVKEGFNDLKTLNPTLAAEWNYKKNHPLSPIQVGSGSARKVWWKCAENHEWQTAIATRNNQRTKCPYCSNKKVLVGFNDVATTHPHLLKEWDYEKNIVSPTEITAGSNHRIWWKCANAHKWESFMYHRGSTKFPTQCPSCNTPTSKLEDEMVGYIESIVPSPIQIIKGNKSILKGKELDVYIPALNIAVEFNGLYWHSEKIQSNRNHHYDKWKNCRNKGIDLLQFWEDDWKHKPEIIKRILREKLSFRSEIRPITGATEIVNLSAGKALGFLKQHHIDDPFLGEIRVGLKDMSTNELMAVMIINFNLNSKNLNILQFATSQASSESFSEVLAYVENTYKPKSILASSDNCMGNGKLYIDNGFKLAEEIKPEYKYVIRNRREPKRNYSLDHFKTDPNLKFEEGLSEPELADLNGFNRIWDAGKTKWELLNRRTDITLKEHDG